MANLYMNGFEWGTVFEWSAFNRMPSSSIKSSDPTPRTGNYCCMLGGSASDNQGEVFLPPSSEIYFQFALYLPSSHRPNPDEFVYYYTRGGDYLIGALYISSTGGLYLKTMDPAQITSSNVNYLQLQGGGTTRLSTDKWYVIEIHLKPHVTAGIFEIRVDGVLDYQYSGWTSSAEYPWVDRLRFYAFWYWYIDDIVVNDTSGSANNSWPNCMKVVLLRPNSEGSYEEWTATGEQRHYDHLNEVPPSMDDYLTAQTSGLRESCHYEGLPEEVETVAVVRSDAWASRSSGSTLSKLIFEVIPGSTIYQSTETELGLANLLHSYAWNFNPETSSNWTVDEVNTLQGGFCSEI